MGTIQCFEAKCNAKKLSITGFIHTNFWKNPQEAFNELTHSEYQRNMQSSGSL